MTAQSPLPRVCGGCGFGEGTFAGASGNDEDAPKAVFITAACCLLRARPGLQGPSPSDRVSTQQQLSNSIEPALNSRETGRMSMISGHASCTRAFDGHSVKGGSATLSLYNMPELYDAI